MASLIGKLFEIEKLGAPITVSERVHVIHVADDRADGLGEFPPAQPTQKVAVREAPVNIVHPRRDELSKLELVAAFGNLNRAKLTRPIIDILKKVAVNGPKVGQVKRAARHTFLKSYPDKPPLDAIKLIKVSEAEFVFENNGAGVNIGVVAHSAAWETPTCRARSKI